MQLRGKMDLKELVTLGMEKKVSIRKKKEIA